MRASMYYVTVEDNRVLGILNYEPNVPETVKVFPISPEQYESLTTSQTHFFNPTKGELELMPEEFEDFKLEKLARTDGKAFLAATDWKILRHWRERTLGITTTLSEEELFHLELKRDEVAKSVSR